MKHAIIIATLLLMSCTGQDIYCGNTVCDKGEETSCPQDCILEVDESLTEHANALLAEGNVQIQPPDDTIVELLSPRTKLEEGKVYQLSEGFSEDVKTYQHNIFFKDITDTGEGAKNNLILYDLSTREEKIIFDGGLGKVLEYIPTDTHVYLFALEYPDPAGCAQYKAYPTENLKTSCHWDYVFSAYDVATGQRTHRREIEYPINPHIGDKAVRWQEDHDPSPRTNLTNESHPLEKEPSAIEHKLSIFEKTAQNTPQLSLEGNRDVFIQSGNAEIPITQNTAYQGEASLGHQYLTWIDKRNDSRISSSTS
ncbi:MAG: hypothetical protein HC945_03330, partial [Nitrosarchaeum sp.]|nr:hypothetical protein [Nitrosarchaeum sp.]